MPIDAQPTSIRKGLILAGPNLSSVYRCDFHPVNDGATRVTRVNGTGSSDIASSLLAEPGELPFDASLVLPLHLCYKRLGQAGPKLLVSREDLAWSPASASVGIEIPTTGPFLVRTKFELGTGLPASIGETGSLIDCLVLGPRFTIASILPRGRMRYREIQALLRVATARPGLALVSDLSVGRLGMRQIAGRMYEADL